KTRKYSDYQLNFFIGYGGKAEIIEAVKGILKDYTKEDVDKINEEVLNRYLWSGALPEPDLIIRTSGEQRLSGFLPLKSSYSELYFCKKYWPDFNYEDFYMAITDFYKRVRRWGR
ncbi:MAG: undecaprenyl diphosphate synthase family protein, partial [Candidatus Anstonellaceae archaeon]